MLKLAAAIICVIFVASISESFGASILDDLFGSSEDDEDSYIEDAKKAIRKQREKIKDIMDKTFESVSSDQMEEVETYIRQHKLEAREVMETALKKGTVPQKVMECRKTVPEFLNPLADETLNEIRKCGEAEYPDLHEKYDEIALKGIDEIDDEEETESDDSEEFDFFDFLFGSSESSNKGTRQAVKTIKRNTIRSLIVRNPKKQIEQIFVRCKKNKCETEKSTACKSFLHEIEMTTERTDACLK